MILQKQVCFLLFYLCCEAKERLLALPRQRVAQPGFRKSDVINDGILPLGQTPSILFLLGALVADSALLNPILRTTLLKDSHLVKGLSPPWGWPPPQSQSVQRVQRPSPLASRRVDSDGSSKFQRIPYDWLRPFCDYMTIHCFSLFKSTSLKNIDVEILIHLQQTSSTQIFASESASLGT